MWAVVVHFKFFPSRYLEQRENQWFSADITGVPTTKTEHFYIFNHAHKVDLQIVQYVHWVCALQSSSLILWCLGIWLVLRTAHNADPRSTSQSPCWDPELLMLGRACFIIIWILMSAKLVDSFLCIVMMDIHWLCETSCRYYLITLHFIPFFSL